MSRVCKRSGPACTDRPLSDRAVRAKFDAWRHVVASCLGPRARLKQVRNGVGGRVSTTSTCSVLLAAVPPSEPLLKLLTACVLQHVQRFGDAGLFAAVLGLSLVDQVTRRGSDSSTAVRVHQRLLELCDLYLTSADCCAKVEVDLGSCRSLLALAHSGVSSKPACGLDPAETQQVSALLLKAFLQTIPCGSTDTVRLGETVVVGVEGEAVENSAVFPGLLLDVPEMLHSGDLERLGPGPYKLALFSASLSGDLSERGNMEIHTGTDPEAALLEKLLKVGEQVVRDCATLFLCQKVIHPVLQQYLRERGVVVVERLGIAILTIFTISGAQAAATSHTPVPAEAFGWVEALSIQLCGTRKMLHLQPTANPAVCTLVLCHRNESMLDELKVTCKRVQHVLQLALKDPVALLGGGCMETHLSAYIRHLSRRDAAEMASDLDCSPQEFLLAADGFCRSLEAAAQALEHDGGLVLMDLNYGHCWVCPADEELDTSTLLSCSCGLINSSAGMEWTTLGSTHPDFCPRPPPGDSTARACVLDSFPAKRNALNVAVEIASLILDVKYVIRDLN
uniref:Uncharacterized protein n=1 Tax=Denticeps clupeoides TaxID=299321 RepID=A0AAY4B0D5_9TELE